MNKHSTIRRFIKGAAPWMALRAAFVALMLILAAFRYYYYLPYEAAMAIVLYPAVAGFAALTLISGPTRRRIDIRLLVFFLLWTAVASLWNYDPYVGQYQDSIHHVLFFALVCYPVAIMQPGDAGKRLVHGVVHVFAFGFAALCAAGIVAVVWNTNFLPLTEQSYPLGRAVIYDDRLCLFMHPNLAAGGCCLTVLLAIYMILSSPKKAVKVYYVVIALVAYVALALTDSRTSILAASAGVGVLGFVVLTGLLKGKPWPLQWGAGFAGFAAAAAVCFFGFSLAFSGVNGLVGLMDNTNARAESQADSAPVYDLPTEGQGISVPQPRDMTDGLRLGNGRDMIWRAALDAINDQPMILLRGTSNERISRTIAPYLGYHSAFDHVHNSFLQTLVAVGIPGFLALAAFLIYLCRWAGDLVFRLKAPRGLASRFLPAVLLAMMVIAVSESMFFMTDQWLYDSVFFLIAGLVVSLAGGVRDQESMGASLAAAQDRAA